MGHAGLAAPGNSEHITAAPRADQQPPSTQRATPAPGSLRRQLRPSRVPPVLSVAGSDGGRPLAPDVRADMEARLGQDFSGVRIHDDGRADESARAVQAYAYTVGSDVVFQRGRYDPGSPAGRLELAHELTHVIQQRTGPVDGSLTADGLRISNPSDSFERQAAANAQRAMNGPTPAAGRARIPAIVGNSAQAGRTVVQRAPAPPAITAAPALPAIQPSAPPGTEILPSGANTPDKVAVQLGDDFDAEVAAFGRALSEAIAAGAAALSAFYKALSTVILPAPASATPPAAVPPAPSTPSSPATPAGPGGAPDSSGLPSALARLESLWIKDMFTALQILRVNGSRTSPRSRTPFSWLVAAADSAAPRTRLVLKAISDPAQIQPADYLGLPPDQVREVKAFTGTPATAGASATGGVHNWDDLPPVGLPRAVAPSAAALTPEQQDQVEYIRRRRAVAARIPGMREHKPGFEYDGTPSKDPQPTGRVAGTAKDAMWQEIAGEGAVSSVNTYDNQRFTWGRGWSAQTTLPAIIDRFFASDPAARLELLEAGFTHRDGKWLFVRTSDGRVLEDNDALDAFKADSQFLSLIANLSEDPAHHQQLTDAQWASTSVPAAVAGWDATSVRFGAHCAQWGSSWADVGAHGPGIARLLPWIARVHGSPDRGATIVGAGATATIRSFAGGAAAGLMRGPGTLPVPPVSGTIYFMTSSGTAWTFP